MKNFARTLLLITVFMMLFVFCSVFAAEAEGTGADFTEPEFTRVSVCLSSPFIPVAEEEDIVFSLYDEAKTELFDSKVYHYSPDSCWTEIEFTVPPYEIGRKFVLCLESGGEALYFCDLSAREHVIETYSCPDGEGGLSYHTRFYMELLPKWSKKAEITVPGVDKTDFFHYIIEDEIYVSEDLLSLLGIKITKSTQEQKPFFTLSTGSGHTAVFYVDDIYATFGGKGENLPYNAFMANEMPFVPLRRVAEYFECNYREISDDDYEKKVCLSLSKHSDEYKEAAFVNEKGYESDTNYLVWVSKKDYMVNVYMGGKGSWRLIRSARCAIGAPSTPTIEGVFKYHQYQTRWQYDGYYCGPIMRFYRGYALHSTLIRNNGKPYDSRVGVKISHGCVRLRPEDINYLVSYVTLGSTVVVTG